MVEITSFQVTTHHGHAIMVNERGQFSADFEGEHLTSRTLDDLTNQIDNLAQKQAKSRKLALAVVADGDRSGVITGFNIRTGEATGLSGKWEYVHSIYPDVPWIKARLVRIRALHNQAADLESTLNDYSMSTRAPGIHSYSRSSVKPEVYVAALDAYEKDYFAKRVAAEAATPAEDWDQADPPPPVQLRRV